MDNITSIVQDKKAKLSDFQKGGLVLGGAVLVTYVVTKRRSTKGVAELMGAVRDGAVADWLSEMSKNGLDVLILSKDMSKGVIDANKLMPGAWEVAA